MTTTMTPCVGPCPVQSYGTTSDGWLLYFRARDGWSLHAWAPGRWDPAKPADDLPAFAYFEPCVSIIDDDEDETTPQDDSENDYPGWWSDEYATLVRDWALALALPKMAAWREPEPDPLDAEVLIAVAKHATGWSSFADADRDRAAGRLVGRGVLIRKLASQVLVGSRGWAYRVRQ